MTDLLGIGSLETLVAATTLFVGAHFILSSAPLRTKGIEFFGEGGFQGVYSIIILLSFVWMILAYSKAPFVIVWEPPPETRMASHIMATLGILLAFLGVTSRNHTSVGSEEGSDDPRPVQGVSTITRHPFLMGASLWALAHLMSNGAVADLILFGGVLLLSIGGAVHIDAKRRAKLGAVWAPISLSSSILPFLAAYQRRVTVDWRGIGLARVAGGLAVALAAAYGHEWVIGVSIVG